MQSRRTFLTTCAAGALVGIADAIGPFQREPRISGVGLSAYSFRDRMSWMKGKPTEGGMDLSDILDFCAAHEVDAAELTAYFFPEPLEQGYLMGLKRKAQVLGIDLSSGAIGNNFAFEPGSAEAARQLDYVKSWIDHYSALGVSSVRVFAGQPPKGVPIETAIDRIVENFKPALEHAGTRGMMLGIENHDFTTEVDRLLEILGRIESPWLGVTLDSANIARTPDPYAELAKIAPYAVTAQIKSSIAIDGKKEPTDFKRVVGILREAGYRGYVVLEYEDGGDPLTEVPREIDRLRAAIG